MTDERGSSRPAEDRFVTEPALWRSVGKGALLGLAIGVLVELIGLLSHNRPSPVLTLGAPVAVLALLQLFLASVAELPPPDQPPDVSRPTPRFFLRLRQLERRLEAATRDGTDYEWTMRPLLAELAADRLRYQHGINYRREPEQARAVMGEQLWQIMITSPDTRIQPVSPARLRELVEQISRI